MQETPWVRSLGGEDPVEEEIATYFSILAWEISLTEEPCGLQSMGLKRVGQGLATEHARGYMHEGKGIIHWEIREDHSKQGKSRAKERVCEEGRQMSVVLSVSRSYGRGWEQMGCTGTCPTLTAQTLWIICVPYLPNRPCCFFLPLASYPFLHFSLCEKGFGHPVPDFGARSLSTAYSSIFLPGLTFLTLKKKN